MRGTIAAAAFLLLASGCERPNKVILSVGPPAANGECIVSYAGLSASSKDEAGLKKLAKAIPADVEVQMTSDQATPYRCIGSAIYTMQMTGIRNIDFTAKQQVP